MKTTNKPLSKTSFSSGISISSLIGKDEKQIPEEIKISQVNTAQQHHFTDTDVKTEWIVFLKQLRQKEPIVFNAIKVFKLEKKDEKTIQVYYPSDSAKSEFDKISVEFFNHFKKKVNNSTIEIVYQKDVENMKIEVVTKKTIFEKFVKINPLLKDLDDLLKFDLS